MAIISASRRTDIPAFYSEWFMKRVEEGYCLVPNPFNRNQISRIDLRPREVDVIVFWTKNPSPMLRFIKRLDSLGFRYYFQFTLNDYPKYLEPRLPAVSKRIDTFKTLSKAIGKERIIWRYDPIVLSSILNSQFHIEAFTRISQELSGFTERVIVSIVDIYKKVMRKLKGVEKEGGAFDFHPIQSKDIDIILEKFALTAKRMSLQIQSCAESRDYSEIGIPPGRCIDGDLINRLWKINLASKKDRGQRKTCGCIRSRDIGMNDTCPNNCTYCYANQNHDTVLNRFKMHDVSDTSLIGSPKPPKNMNRSSCSR